MHDPADQPVQRTRLHLSAAFQPRDGRIRHAEKSGKLRLCQTQLLTGHANGTALVWDLDVPAAAAPTALDGCWADLAAGDGPLAWVALAG